MKAPTPHAALRYFALVFAAGFALGALRVPLLVPRLGERWAELLEMPLMAGAIYFAARHVVRRERLEPGAALAAGVVALALMLLAEVLLVTLLRGLDLRSYIASRDPVSGVVYLAMLGGYALLPALLARVDRARLSSAHRQ